MRAFAATLLVAGLVLAGCGEDAGDRGGEARATTPGTSSTPTVRSDAPVRLAYPTPEALAKASPVVVLGTVESWEDGPSLVVAQRGGGEERIPYAVVVIRVVAVIKDEARAAAGSTIAVPVRLDEGATSYEELAPEGSNVAFLGGDDVDPTAEVEPGGPVDPDRLLWAEPQGLVLETSAGELVNADPQARSDLWPDVVAVPAGEQFGMLAQRLMAIRG